MARILLNIPGRARRGEIITIKTLIQHKMETGFRYTSAGERVPRDIVTELTVTYDGEEIFHAELSPAIAANPFLSFHTVATQSGTIRLTWSGDNGFSAVSEAPIVVE